MEFQNAARRLLTSCLGAVTCPRMNIMYSIEHIEVENNCTPPPLIVPPYQMLKLTLIRAPPLPSLDPAQNSGISSQIICYMYVCCGIKWT